MPHSGVDGNICEGAKEQRLRLMQLFNASAQHYDRINRMMSLGTGNWYRRQALLRAGLEPRMTVLDVGCGTGTLASYAARIVGPSGYVVALDPSKAMLQKALRHSHVSVTQGLGECLPFADNCFDMLSMGYALRHVTSLDTTFREYQRVLKPGGVVLLLEITPAQGRLVDTLLKLYLKFIIPTLTWLCTLNRDARVLMSYYWESIERSAPPQTILHALQSVGFAHVHRNVMLGIFSAYTAKKQSSWEHAA